MALTATRTTSAMASFSTFKESIDRYVALGVPTGGFLEAVISNDLQEACGRADETSRLILFELVFYLHCACPAQCWGSREKYQSWIASHAKQRTETNG